MKYFFYALALGTYLYMLNLFYKTERGEVLSAYSYYRDQFIVPKVLDKEFELIILYGLVAFMTIGYVAGLRKSMFVLFLYHVPFQMVKGEYERSFEGGADYQTLRLALFLGGICMADLMGKHA